MLKKGTFLTLKVEISLALIFCNLVVAGGAVAGNPLTGGFFAWGNQPLYLSFSLSHGHF